MNEKNCTGIDEVINFCLAWQEKDDYEYMKIDGMVVKVNDYALQGRVWLHRPPPQMAIAFKFKAKQATSKLWR